MLIIDINATENKENKGHFFKKQVRPDPFKRSSVSVCGKSCVFLELNEKTVHTLNLVRLLNTFKGGILCSDKVSEVIVPAEYRFDCRPYFKRALLSSLVNTLGESAKGLSLCVKDSDFVFTEEYLNIANSVKSFSLISRENIETEKFSGRCFVDFGNYINISDNYVSADVFVDFNKIELDSKIMIIKEGRSQLLYPDPRYFTVKDDMLPLINMGIDPKLVCSAFSTVA